MQILWSLTTLSDSFSRNVLWQPKPNPLAAPAFASQVVFWCLSVAVRRREVETGERTWPAVMWNLKHFLITGQPLFTPQTGHDIRGGGTFIKVRVLWASQWTNSSTSSSAYRVGTVGWTKTCKTHTLCWHGHYFCTCALRWEAFSPPTLSWRSEVLR